MEILHLILTSNFLHFSYHFLKPLPRGALLIGESLQIIHRLFQNNYQQDDTYGLAFISGLVVLQSTCFELQEAHHQEFTFLLYRQPLAYCVIFCCIPPVLLRVLFHKCHLVGNYFGKIIMIHGTMNVKKKHSQVVCSRRGWSCLQRRISRYP